MLKKRIVIKIGTNLLTDTNQQLDLNNMRNIVNQISTELSESSPYEFIIVSSGAITCGANHINIRPNNLPEQQAVAAIGQILLFQQYFDFFQKNNKRIGQLLVTTDNFEHPQKKLNISQTITTLLSKNVIPIINENDSVSTDEIQFGDNDQLSSILAIHIHASQLIILTNTDGLLDHESNVVPKLSCIGQKELDLVDKSSQSLFSKGGMTSKLLAAKLALANNIPTTIANGRTDRVIHKILTNAPIGTKISTTS